MKRYVQQKFETVGKFLFFSFMAESFQPFLHNQMLQSTKIARTELSKSCNHLQLLLVRDTEQITLHVAPVITKCLSTRRSRKKDRWTPFIQVFGRNTSASVVQHLSSGLLGVTEEFSPHRVWCNPEAFLSSFACLAFGIWPSVSLSPLCYNITMPDLALNVWNKKCLLCKWCLRHWCSAWPLKKPSSHGNCSPSVLPITWDWALYPCWEVPCTRSQLCAGSGGSSTQKSKAPTGGEQCI